MIAEVKQPTLWITHTMDLLNQSMEAAKKFLGLSGNQIGIIQGENMSIGTHMTLATVQTLSKRDLTEIREKFGCVVIDEAHLVFKNDKAACMFESVISQFSAYYRFGLTASEHRSDGLIDSMFDIIGPKFYEVAQDDPRLSVMKPSVEFIETEFLYEVEEDEDGEKEMLNVQQMLKAMREDFYRQSIVQGDPAKDRTRLIDIAGALGDLDYRATADANEQYQSLADLRILVGTIQNDAALAPLARRLLYIEQPFARETTWNLALGKLVTALTSSSTKLTTPTTLFRERKRSVIAACRQNPAKVFTNHFSTAPAPPNGAAITPSRRKI